LISVTVFLPVPIGSTLQSHNRAFSSFSEFFSSIPLLS